jgi:nicotinamidase-related amidase
VTGTDSVWGRRIGFGHAPLVLVVDLARAFTEPPRPLASDVSDVIGASNRLIDVARENGHPVLFTTVGYDNDDLSDAGLWARKIGGQSDLRLGSDGVVIDPRVHVQARDPVLVKKYASCFFGTDLTSRLNASGIDTVVICGVSTSGCIRATAVDAIQSGFRPIVVREAVGDRWQAAHEQSLLDMDAKYADIVALEQALAALRLSGR